MKKLIVLLVALMMGAPSIAQQLNKAESGKKQQAQPVRTAPAQVNSTKEKGGNTKAKPAGTQSSTQAVAPMEPAGKDRQPSDKAAAPKTKKDGTPDRRFKENQKLKKDGTPDMRYKQNKDKKPAPASTKDKNPESGKKGSGK
jgi:hypothetical protein